MPDFGEPYLNPNLFKDVSRFEVIDHTTRKSRTFRAGAVTGWRGMGIRVVSLQDNGRTLKVFLKDAE